MKPLSTAVLVFTAFCQLGVADRVLAQTIPTAARERLSFEDAARLTWRLETRADGIAALRAVVSEAPENTDARFELGRVLTWDIRTRPEGISVLREVAERRPDRADIAEALAEVLAWNPETRAEAIRHLRGLLQRAHGRSSARLKLAEVLSWDPATRDESRELYKRALHDDQHSVEASVGLARVLSWSGRVSEARAWYELALARNPDTPSARNGIAEIQGWNGGARASLKTLSTMPAGTIDTPDAFRLRAQAYSQIGRPARALEQYERLLSLDPGNTAALQASRVLRQGLRPSLEIATEASTESGDQSNKVETASVPFRFAFHPNRRDTEVSISAAQAVYRNSRGSSRDQFVGAGVDAPIGDRVRLSADLMAHFYDDAERTVTGRGQFQVAVHDGFDVRLGVAREQLSSSRLSLAGERVEGTFYGPSYVNQAMIGVSAHGHGWDVWAHATGGQIRGVSVANNARNELFMGGGTTYHPGGMTVRPGYSLAWMSYDVNLSGFPGDAGDGVNTPGIGGYFSPARFLNQMARVDVTLPIGDSFVVVGGTGVGRQRVDQFRSPGAAPLTTSSDAFFGIRARAGERTSIGTQASYQNVASAFNRTAVRVTMTYGF